MSDYYPKCVCMSAQCFTGTGNCMWYGTLSRFAFPNMVPTSYRQLFILIQMKQNKKFSFSVTLVTLQMLHNSHIRQNATILEGADAQHLYHWRWFYWVDLAWTSIRLFSCIHSFLFSFISSHSEYLLSAYYVSSLGLSHGMQW